MKNKNTTPELPRLKPARQTQRQAQPSGCNPMTAPAPAPRKTHDTREQAGQFRQEAERRLKAAAEFASLHATVKPLFSKRMGKGQQAVMVRIVWPGTLGVYDPETGRCLAISEPGQPDTLAARFDPTPCPS